MEDWADELTSDVKQSRLRQASADFETNMPLFLGTPDIRLEMKADTHYQIRVQKLDWIINLYPSTQRIWVDRKHAKVPFLEAPRPWALMDVWVAAVEQMQVTMKDPMLWDKGKQKAGKK